MLAALDWMVFSVSCYVEASPEGVVWNFLTWGTPASCRKGASFPTNQFLLDVLSAQFDNVLLPVYLSLSIYPFILA